jgi:hypothetical protein
MSSRPIGSRVYECDISLHRVIGPVGYPSHPGDRVVSIRGGSGRPIRAFSLEFSIVPVLPYFLK